MTVLAAYFDDSGFQHDKSRPLLGGGLARIAYWREFAREWQAALDEWGIEWFHMNEAESMSGPPNGQRNKYGWTPTERDHRIERLARIVDRYVPYRLVAAVDQEAQRRILGPLCIDEPVFEARFLMPYTDVFGHALRRVRFIADKIKVDPADVALFFARQKGIGESTKELYKEACSWWGMQEPEFYDPRACAPLQAADMIAWVANWQFENPGKPGRARHAPVREVVLDYASEHFFLTEARPVIAKAIRLDIEHRSAFIRKAVEDAARQGQGGK